jgi:hypothetical protein
MAENPYRRWEIFGIFVIAVVGTSLHFTYELTGRNLLVAVFSAVNESVWEHLKLVFWPAAGFTLIQTVYFQRLPSSFLAAKAVGILVMPAVILVMYYTSKLFGVGSLAFDIFTFYLSVVLGQLSTIKLLKKNNLPKTASYLGLTAIAILAVAFTYFTFDPPRVPLFQDPVTGGYGLIR